MRNLVSALAASLLLCAAPTHAQSFVPAPNLSFGGDFTLTSPSGATVTLQTFHGANLVLAFCATPELARLATALQLADPSGKKLRAVLVTQAAPPKLPPRISSLSGAPAQVQAAASEYGATDPSTAATLFYLIGPDGKFIALIPATLSPEQMAGQLSALSR